MSLVYQGSTPEYKHVPIIICGGHLTGSHLVKSLLVALCSQKLLLSCCPMKNLPLGIIIIIIMMDPGETSRHVPLERDPGCYGRPLYPFWPGNALGSPTVN